VGAKLMKESVEPAEDGTGVSRAEAIPGHPSLGNGENRDVRRLR